MKTFLVFLFLCILVGGGYVGYHYLMKSGGSGTAGPSRTAAAPVTKTGVVQKLTKPGDDYTHMLKTSEGLIKLNSYSVKLDQYVNKNVTVTGQYSGSTLFADSVK
jgi:hypothetical protein